LARRRRQGRGVSSPLRRCAGPRGRRRTTDRRGRRPRHRAR
jgi:hypothetical protein